MSSTDVTPAEHDAAHEDAHHGPTPREYVRIAVVLAVLTALEVSTYFVDFGPLGIPLLIGLMIIKFTMVAGFFMHLKFDSPHFSRLFHGGLALAASLYATTLVVMLFASAPSV